ncbi:hypothetical protein KKD19_02530 [Patescibacteria group bacterium]|nr:hypothetical protein [Patescibacteria group bacterium]MBU4512096.1 hypothetical protein [Patescibacteria group bacterium]MCG2693421.1 DUF6516 family protein [Candidatus Parcubacteria bacterium]
MPTLEDLQSIAKDQFLDIVVDIIKPSPDKLRLILKDKSFIDIRLSQKIKNRFDFHWERRHLDKTIYRYDNFPDTRFKRIKTFPCHFHKGKDNQIIESPFRKKFPGAFSDFMEFVRKTM